MPKDTTENVDRGELSDGYHTFNELYLHRYALFLAFLRAHGGGWASRLHADGTMYEGHFIVGVYVNGKQISYHLPNDLWPAVEDLGIVVDNPPEWDGHHSADVVERLLEYVDAPREER